MKEGGCLDIGDDEGEISAFGYMWGIHGLHQHVADLASGHFAGVS